MLRSYHVRTRRHSSASQGRLAPTKAVSAHSASLHVQSVRPSTPADTIFAASSPTPTEPEASASSSHAVPPYPPLMLSTRIASSRLPQPTLVATVPVPVPVHVKRRRRLSQTPPGCVQSTSANTAATPRGTCDSSAPRSAAAAAVNPDHRAPRAPSRDATSATDVHRAFREVKYEQYEYRLSVFGLNLYGTRTFTDQNA
jgi:hypothetical protein